MGFAISKTPGGVLDYGFDWSAWLGADTIVVSVWSFSSNPGDAASLSMDDKTTTLTWVRISGGTLGQKYIVKNHITTASGLQEERLLAVTIRDK